MIEVIKIWLTETAVHILTSDGREAIEEFANYPRLRRATAEQLNQYEEDAIGIHWPLLDEDLAFDQFFKEKRFNPAYDYFMQHPEISAAEVARNLGMSQMDMMRLTTSGGINGSV